MTDRTNRMTTADAKVTKLTPEMQQAWVELDIGFEPKEPLTISQCDFVRNAFFAGWAAALEAPHSMTEAITPEMRFAARQTGDVANQMSSPELDAIYIAMQAARPIDLQGVGVPASPSDWWRDVPGYEGLYWVSRSGEVYDIQRDKTRALVLDGCGYLTVRLTKDGAEKRYSVHRLVCQAFNGEPPVGAQCAHLDGDPSNNLASNLKWATPSENNAHKLLHGTHQAGEKHPRAKLTDQQIADIRARAGAGGTLRSIAADFGVHETYVGKLVRGERWKVSENASAAEEASSQSGIPNA